MPLFDLPLEELFAAVADLARRPRPRIRVPYAVAVAAGKAGMVNADEFLTAMEQTGIIVPVGAWVIQEVCRQATYWARTFPSHRPVRVTANVSRRQLLKTLGLSPGAVVGR